MAVGERMKYFMIVQSENNPFPEIVNWNRALDVRALNREAYRSLPPFLMLDMRLDLDAYMPDILVSPFLLLSREAMEDDLTRALEAMDPFIDRDCWAMNYPYGSAGSYNDDVLSFLRKNGCCAGFTTKAETADLNVCDRLLIPRYDTNDFPAE